MQRMNQSTDTCGHCGGPFAQGETRLVMSNVPYHQYCINAAISPDGKIAALERRVADLERRMRHLMPERDPLD